MIREANEIRDLTKEGTATRDAALIVALQKIEHYEIATYGTLVAMAKKLELNQAAELLAATLAEEKSTDEKLTDIAEKQ